MDRGVACNGVVQSSRYDGKRTSLAKSRHAQGLPVILGQGADEVHRTYRPKHDPVIIGGLPIVPVHFPIFPQRTVEKLVVVALLHRDRNPMDTNLQGDRPLLCATFRQ